MDIFSPAPSGEVPGAPAINSRASKQFRTGRWNAPPSRALL
jgi:hypothetical protein